MKSYEITEFESLNKGYPINGKLSLPSTDVFAYVHERAKEGNEMALMLLFEWTEFCSPQNCTERKIYHNIHCAIKELFR